MILTHEIEFSLAHRKHGSRIVSAVGLTFFVTRRVGSDDIGGASQTLIY